MPESSAGAGPRLPLRPVEPDYVATLERAHGYGAAFDDLGEQLSRSGLEDVVFTGCGGSWASSVHASVTLRAAMPGLSVSNIASTVFVAAPPARLGPRTLVVASAHSGATAETVAAARLAADRGAFVMTVSRDRDCELASVADRHFWYGSERTVTPAKQLILAHLVRALRQQAGVAPDGGGLADALGALPSALPGVIDQLDPALAEIAAELTGAPFSMIVAAGPNYGAAYLLSMCYLMEMQWRASASFEAGEFFHGAFEMLAGPTAALVLVGEDSSRPAAARAAAFTRRYSLHSRVLDSREIALPGVPDRLRAEITPIVLGVLAGRLAEHAEASTGHSLDERRYMNRVSY